MSNEKSKAFINLITCGPSSKVTYYTAHLAKDILFIVILNTYQYLYIGVISLLFNYSFGGQLLFHTGLLILLNIAQFIILVLCAILTDKLFTAISIFASIQIIGILALLGKFLETNSLKHSVLGVISAFVRWLTPFQYWSLSLMNPVFIIPLVLFMFILLAACISAAKRGPA